MKRNIIAIMMVMVALLATQCKKSAEPLANEPAGETMEVTVRVQNNTAKTEITAAGAVSWKKGDKLYVVGETQGLLGHVSAVSDGDPVQFEGKITALTSPQVLRFYYVGDKDFTLDGSGNYIFDLSSQDGTLEGIAAHSQLMFGMSGEIAVGTADFGTITMTSLMAIAHLNITGNTSNTVTVTGGFATSTFNAKTYDGATLTGATGIITMTSASAIGNCHLALLPGTQTLTFASNNGAASLSAKAVVANTFYNSGSAKEVEIIEGVLPGLFTIAPGKKVYFSKGNLQATYHTETSKYTWSFAENQYDFIGNAAGNKTIQEDGSNGDGAVVDLFGWSTNKTLNAYNFGIDKTHQPADYYGDFVDWGQNAIENGGNQPNVWCTLCSVDFEYIFHSRTNADDLYGKGMVNNKKGVFILPDDWSLPSDLSFIPGNASYVNDYDLEEWAKMEAAGAVFLPQAGKRVGTTVSFDNTTWYYWTSSGWNDATACTLYTNDGFGPTGINDTFNTGFPVRLVYDPNPTK